MDSGLQEDSIRRFPHFPCIPCCHFCRFRLFRIAPCSLVLRTFRIQSPYHPYLIRTASEHFPTLPHHVHSLATLSLSIAFLSRVSFCFAFVRIPHHYHVLYIHITSTSSPSISGLAITTILLALLTSHFMLPTMSLTGDSQYLKSVPDVGCASSLGR